MLDLNSNSPNQTTPLVALVIVHYNNLEDTMNCLHSAQQLDYPNFFTVVVDNCSPDRSGEWLQNQFQSQTHRVILNVENRGFAAGANLGIAYALKYDAEFVWLVNPDTVLAKRALVELIDYAQHHPECGALGSKILYGPKAEGQAGVCEQKIWGIGGVIDFSKQQIQMRGAEEVDHNQYDEVAYCDYLPGCSLLIRACVLRKVGLLPEEYFMYFEETDWCSRTKKAGYQLAVIPRSVVWHNFNQLKLQQPFMVYYYNRNSFLFWYRYSNSVERIRIILKVSLKILPRVFNAWLHAPNDQLKAVFQAHLAACLHFLLGHHGSR